VSARPAPASAYGRVHFIGIGGAGMSGVARIMLDRGVVVSGSDAHDSPTLASLRALGATVQVGHAPGQVADVDTVVVSTAIRESNPELVEARRRGLRVLPRAAALAAVMAGQRAVTVAGTHGKTTTTSMLVVALQRCGADPSYAIGGTLPSGANAHDGQGDVFVAEADESDGSFVLYTPDVAVVTNVEPDHLDHYGTAEAVHAAFRAFLARVVPTGVVVLCADDPGSSALVDTARERGLTVRTYGESPAADVRVDELVLEGSRSHFSLLADGAALGPVQMQVPGRHYALDAAAAITAGMALGFPSAGLREGIAGFTGTRRRFELKGAAGGVRVYDSYAHHPTEIVADLRAAREVAGAGRIVVVFQPHLYSRTRFFAPDLGRALGLADEVIVMEVYAAREDPLPGVTGALVADAVPLPADRVHFEPSWAATPPLLAARANPGDVVLTLGAGDVTGIGPRVLELLEQGGPA